MNPKIAKDIMTKEVVTISPDTSISDASKLLYKNRFNGLPVVDKNKVLVGILTEYDLVNIDSATHLPTLQRILRHVAPDDGAKEEIEAISKLKVGNLMNSDPMTLREYATLEETIAAFSQHHKVNPIPVVDENKKLVGIISRSDMIKFFTELPPTLPESELQWTNLKESAITGLVEKSMDLLEERMDLLQMNILSSEQAMLITTPDAEIIFANKAWEKLTGYTTEEIIGKHPNDLWGGHMPEEFYRDLWNTIKNEKKPFAGEVKNVKKDGTEYWQETYITPVLDEAGNIKFFMAIEPEITDKKKKEQFREEFISIIGHQLRNPLAGISWIIELLSRSPNLSEDDKKKVEEIYKQNKGLANFVADLLVLSRIGRKDMSKEDFDLRSEIDLIIKEVKVANPGVEFSFQSEGGDFSLMTNKPMVIQVFANLIYNAAEYSDRDAGRVDLELKKESDSWFFSCYNNGPEIKEADKSKIFSKFFRSDTAQKIKEKGTGLGLFIIKTICDNFGWGLWFESASGQGTTFYVKIPIVNS